MADPGTLSFAAIEVINARRRELGISGKTLAEMVGMPQTSLARLLRHGGQISLDELSAIATALGTNLPGMVHDTIQKLPPPS